MGAPSKGADCRQIMKLAQPLDIKKARLVNDSRAFQI